MQVLKPKEYVDLYINVIHNDSFQIQRAVMPNGLNDCMGLLLNQRH